MGLRLGLKPSVVDALYRSSNEKVNTGERHRMTKRLSRNLKGCVSLEQVFSLLGGQSSGGSITTLSCTIISGRTSTASYTTAVLLYLTYNHKDIDADGISRKEWDARPELNFTVLYLRRKITDH
jgi:hypothetical protein